MLATMSIGPDLGDSMGSYTDAELAQRGQRLREDAAKVAT
jgi:hypothetical protein